MQIVAAATLAQYRSHYLTAYGTSEGAVKGWDTRGRGRKALGRVPDVMRMHGWKEHPSQIRYVKPNPTVPGRKHYNHWEHPKYGKMSIAYGAQGDFKHWGGPQGTFGNGKADRDHPINQLVHDYLNNLEGKPQATPESKVAQPAPKPQGNKVTSEIEQTLATGEVTSTKDLGGGVNKTQIVQLENGTKGVFKPQDGAASFEMRHNITPGKDTEREVGAWEVAKLVGLEDLATPTVERTIDGHRGALLQFENGRVAMIVTHPYDGKENAARVAVFDFVIGNTDRHTGNWLVEGQGDMAKLHLIDHGLAFPESTRAKGRNMFAQHIRWDSPVKNPRDYADPYVTKKGAILNTLSNLGLPKKAVDGVGARIDTLVKDSSWASLASD